MLNGLMLAVWWCVHDKSCPPHSQTLHASSVRWRVLTHQQVVLAVVVEQPAQVVVRVAVRLQRAVAPQGLAGLRVQALWALGVLLPLPVVLGRVAVFRQGAAQASVLGLVH